MPHEQSASPGQSRRAVVAGRGPERRGQSGAACESSGAAPCRRRMDATSLSPSRTSHMPTTPRAIAEARRRRAVLSPTMRLGVRAAVIRGLVIQRRATRQRRGRQRAARVASATRSVRQSLRSLSQSRTVRRHAPRECTAPKRTPRTGIISSTAGRLSERSRGSINRSLHRLRRPAARPIRTVGAMM